MSLRAKESVCFAGTTCLWEGSSSVHLQSVKTKLGANVINRAGKTLLIPLFAMLWALCYALPCAADGAHRFWLCFKLNKVLVAFWIDVLLFCSFPHAPVGGYALALVSHQEKELVFQFTLCLSRYNVCICWARD